MIYCLLISRIFLSPVSLFFMMAGSLAQVSSICSSWESDHDFENNQDQSIILWEKNELPFIDCPLYCGMDHSCRSFFYHPSLEKCLGSKSYKRGLPDNQAMQQGWNYYTRPQHCDGGYIYNATLAVCYKFHKTGWSNYSKAMDVCETEGAKLLIITNDDQLQYFRKISDVLSELYDFTSLSGSSPYLLQTLQNVQHTSAWIIFRISRPEHSSPLFGTLHLLFIRYIIKYKSCSLCYYVSLTDSSSASYSASTRILYMDRTSKIDRKLCMQVVERQNCSEQFSET